MEDKRVPIVQDKDFHIVSKDGLTDVRFLRLIARGGSALAYKAEICENGRSREGIIKEFYPFEMPTGGIQYHREAPYTPVKLSREDGQAEAERERQNRRVNEEISKGRQFFFDKEQIINNPYGYDAKLLCKAGEYGDCAYVILGTNRGETLENLLGRLEEKGEKMTLLQAISFTKKIINVVQCLSQSGKRICHGDIKPSNLFIEGVPGDDNCQVVLLDFGSAFDLAQFKVDVEALSDQEILEAADRILEQDGIGFSSEGYASKELLCLAERKSIYGAHYVDKELRNGPIKTSVDCGRRLLMAMNAMSEKSDWYSVLCTFFRMASVSEEDEMYQPVSDMLQRIESIDTKELLLCELNALEDIIQKKPNIYTMRREIQKDCDLIIRKYKDIDPSIYGILRKN